MSWSQSPAPSTDPPSAPPLPPNHNDLPRVYPTNQARLTLVLQNFQQFGKRFFTTPESIQL